MCCHPLLHTYCKDLTTVILHSEADEAIPIAESRELLQNSGLPASALIVVGSEHRLADPEALKAMLKAIGRVARG